MKNLFIKTLIFCLLAGIFSQANFAQKKPTLKPAPATKKITKPAAKTATVAAAGNESEDESFNKAKDTPGTAERVQDLQGFLAAFPGSKHKSRAQELIVSARAQMADEKIQAGDTDGGVALYELAVKEAPEPVTEQLYTLVLRLVPRSLVYKDQRAAAIRIANVIETKVGNNAARLLDLAAFHLNIENADDAQRTAKKAAEADPASAPAYEALGMSYRTNLKIAEAADAYEKGLQTGNRLPTTLLYLADAKRALGKPDEALVLYREVLTKQPDTTAAKTGVVMSLFDNGKRTEAEAELKRTIAADPKNFTLLAGAAYWYAAHEDGAKAVEFALQAIAIEPRYVWSYVAMSRGLMLQKRFIEADRAMLQATQFGKFPTIDYESANAKFAVGFYDEAIADLSRSFRYKDGGVGVYLAGRVPQIGDSFSEILALERKAGIFEPAVADSPENDKKLKELFAFDLKLNEKDASEADIISAAEIFIGAPDAMQTYRRMYIADKLLKKRVAPAKVLELTQTAVSGIDNAIDQPGAAAAVLADELLTPRATALANGTVVTVPDIPRATLQSVMRGRVEEMTGWALFQQQKNEEALVHLRRAIGVLPEKSAWWRSSVWKLGVVLDATGRPEEAFQSYARSFMSGEQETTKLAVLLGLCQRLYNSSADCNDRIIAAAKTDPKTAKPSNSVLKSSVIATPDNRTATVRPEAPVPAATVKPTPGPALSAILKPKPTPAAVTTPTPIPMPSPAPKREFTATPSPKVPDAIEASAIKPAVTDAVKTQSTDAAEQKKPEATEPTETVAKATNGEARPRIVRAEPKQGVVYSNPAAQVTVGSLPADPKSGCQVVMSVPKLSLISNGGWSSIAVDLRGEGNLEELIGVSDNPEDISIELQPEIGKNIRRRLWVVKSLTDKKGEFKIHFETPCGDKKEVIVTTR
jgi:tetratricopeptide (TPR) repeat protein